MTSSVPARDAHGRFVSAGAEVQIPAKELSELRNMVGEYQANEIRLVERLEQIEMMVDANGWTPLYEYGQEGGLTLGTLHAASKQIRELVIGNPFMKRGSQLRITYVWGGGVEFTTVNEKGESKRMSTALKAMMKNPVNVKNVFSANAQEQIERAAFTDGMIFALADDAKKTYSIIPLEQIQGMLHNPDDTSEIWAYRRVWKKNPNDIKSEPDVRWYYTDSFPETETRKGRIKHLDKMETIDQTKTIIDHKVNGQFGWALGVPDGLSAIGWVKLYREFLVNGHIMSRALAQFAYKATAKTQDGANKNALTVGKPQSSGSTIFSSDDFAPLASAGKGYDFNSGRPIAAAIAAALEVSLVGLTSDPGAGGGSYGTAQTLDPPAKATAALRRASWEDWYNRIFRHAGMVGTSTLRMVWHELREETVQRQMQALTIAWNSGLFEGTIIQGLIAEVLSIADPGNIPDGVMLPNNEKSLGRKDVDSDGQTVSPTAGSGQGQSTPAGQGDPDHDDDSNPDGSAS